MQLIPAHGSMTRHNCCLQLSCGRSACDTQGSLADAKIIRVCLRMQPPKHQVLLFPRDVPEHIGYKEICWRVRSIFVSTACAVDSFRAGDGPHFRPLVHASTHWLALRVNRLGSHTAKGGDHARPCSPVKVGKYTKYFAEVMPSPMTAARSTSTAGYCLRAATANCSDVNPDGLRGTFALRHFRRQGPHHSMVGVRNHQRRSSSCTDLIRLGELEAWRLARPRRLAMRFPGLPRAHLHHSLLSRQSGAYFTDRPRRAHHGA